MGRVPELLFNLTQRRLPGGHIGVGEVAEGVCFGAFNKAAAVENPIIWKPHHDIVRRMPRTRVKGLEGVFPDRKSRITVEHILGPVLVSGKANGVRHSGGVGLDALAAVVIQASGSVCMRMRGDAHHRRLVVPCLDAVE